MLLFSDSYVHTGPQKMDGLNSWYILRTSPQLFLKRGREGNVPLGRDRAEMVVFCEARIRGPQIIYHMGYNTNVWCFEAFAEFNADSNRSKFYGKKLHTSLRCKRFLLAMNKCLS